MEAKIMIHDFKAGDYEHFFDTVLSSALPIDEVCEPQWNHDDSALLMHGLIKIRIKEVDAELADNFFNSIYGLKRYANLFRCYRVEVFKLTARQLQEIEPDISIVDEVPAKRGRKRTQDGTPKKPAPVVKTPLEKIQSYNWKEFDELDLDEKPTLDHLLQAIGVSLDDAREEYMGKKKEGTKGRQPAWFLGLSMYKKKLEADN
eukprot:TRINITY_DN558_c0_g1_i1.p1 TRINITY_DN558_c0_g1~~TRINITY_DN558_c0_g1_i1.p1  ORF type:complete len:237 (+),score=43.10 TRINITY_DN558_c0_g1_i1:104-712(+)